MTYDNTDSDADSVIDADVDNDSVNTDDLSGEFSVRVSSLDELEAIDQYLDQGDTVVVEQPDTPYRNTQWIDIDTPNVTIEFESRWARNGEPIIKVADGANVGGPRVGYNTAVEDVTLRGIGVDGNHPNQDQSVKRLHNVIFHAGDNHRIEDFFCTRSSPYHEHSSGGSAVTARSGVTEFSASIGRIHDTGDRGIQTAAQNSNVSQIVTTDGYDRSVAADVLEPDGNYYVADECSVRGVTGYNNSDGSLVGAHNNGSRGPRDFTITGCAAYGMRGLISAFGNVTIVGNVAQNLSVRGIKTGFGTATVVGNRIENVEGPGIIGSAGSIYGYNYISNTTYGIEARSEPVTLGVNYFEDTDRNSAGKAAIYLDNKGGNWLMCNIVTAGNGPGVQETSAANRRSTYIGNSISVSGTTWDLQYVGRMEANFPKPTFDAAPANPEFGEELIASATWDPDGDGNGEKVKYDGGAWQEVVDMPNV